MMTVDQMVAPQALTVIAPLLDTEAKIDLLSAAVLMAGLIITGLIAGNVYIRLKRDRRQQREDILRRSEARYRALITASAQAVWTTNAAGAVVEDNPSWRAMTGQSEAEIMGWGWINAIHPDDRPRTAQVWTEAVAAKSLYEIEHRINTADRGYRLFYVRAVPLLDETGTIYEWIGVDTDITEGKQFERALKQTNEDLEKRVTERTAELSRTNLRLQQELLERERTEQALRLSEERYRAIVEDQTELICRFLPDSTILFVNAAYCRYFGLNQEEMLGKSYNPVIHEDDIEQVWQRVKTISADNPVVTIENQVVVAGEIRWTQWINRAFFNQQGQVIEYQSVGRDITERKRAEGERKRAEAILQESNRRWRSLLDNVQLLVIELDQNGNVEYANPFFLELAGYTQVEVLGKNWFENFLPRPYQSQVQVCFREVLEHNFHPHYQNPIRTRSGEERLIAWSNTLLKDLQGAAIGTISIGEDITERFRLDQMKAEFISIVSHELRTPLTSMQGALSLLNGGLVDPNTSRGQRIIKIAAEGVDRLVRLVNDILDLERLESGKINLEKQSCDTATLITRAAEQMQSMVNQAGVLLRISPQAFAIYVDADRILQVLTNLLSNAIKFSPTGSTIWLSVSPSTHPSIHPSTPYLRFTIQDHGRGIPPDKLESIFERFQQVDASDARQKGGTGLGLAICRTIVQQHGGQIWVESTLGEGSCFYFTLPFTLPKSGHDTYLP